MTYCGNLGNDPEISRTEFNNLRNILHNLSVSRKRSEGFLFTLLNINYIVTAVCQRSRPVFNYYVITNYKILLFPLYRLIKQIMSFSENIYFLLIIMQIREVMKLK